MWIAITAVLGAVAVVLLRRAVNDLTGRIEAHKSGQNLIAQLEHAGVDLSAPHEVEFFLYFPSKAAARAAGEELRYRYHIDVHASPDGKWTCLATTTMVPALVGDVRSEMEGVAARHGGEYDGWAVAAS